MKTVDEIMALVAATKALLRRDQRNTCSHDETYRSGSIWEICRSCGQKWSDDLDPKPELVDPPEWEAAHTAIDAIEAALKEREAPPKAQPMSSDYSAFENAVREYIEEYEMLGETGDGCGASYTPNENDKALLLDAFMGFDFSPWRLRSEPMKAADEFELRRLLEEEKSTTRQLIRALGKADNGPTFMGEPVLSKPPKAQPMSSEKEIAICEGHFNQDSEAYFSARPQLDNAENRRIFYAGHRKGWLSGLDHKITGG